MKTLKEKIARRVELLFTCDNYSHEMSVEEFNIVRREINNLDIQIRAEQGLENGEFKKLVSGVTVNTLHELRGLNK